LIVLNRTPETLRTQVEAPPPDDDLPREDKLPRSGFARATWQFFTHLSMSSLTRRIIFDDRQHGLELSEHTYAPGSESADVATHHSGEELGIVLEGRLAVEINDTTYELGAGDAVHFSSSTPHRFENRARRATRAIWLNIHPK